MLNHIHINIYIDTTCRLDLSNSGQWFRTWISLLMTRVLVSINIKSYYFERPSSERCRDFIWPKLHVLLSCKISLQRLLVWQNYLEIRNQTSLDWIDVKWLNCSTGLIWSGWRNWWQKSCGLYTTQETAQSYLTWCKILIIHMYVFCLIHCSSSTTKYEESQKRFRRVFKQITTKKIEMLMCKAQRLQPGKLVCCIAFQKSIWSMHQTASSQIVHVVSVNI